MKNIYILLISILPVLSSAQKSDKDCKALRHGTFEIYQSGKKLGLVYRKDQVQIEKYEEMNKLTYVKSEADKCDYVLSDYLKRKRKGLMSFEVIYTWVSKGVYEYKAKPVGLDVAYLEGGKIIKMSNSIPKEYRKKFKELSKIDH